jgi:hypothetical protein
MTMLLRENAIQTHLVRWEVVTVLTGTGRRRISAGSRTPGIELSFENRGVVGSLHREPANLKESVRGALSDRVPCTSI